MKKIVIVTKNMTYSDNKEQCCEWDQPCKVPGSSAKQVKVWAHEKKTFVKSFFCRICAKFWTSQKVSLQHSLAKWPMFVLLVFKSRQGGTCTRSVVGMGILNHILILWIELLLFSGIWFFYLEFSDMVIILATTIKKKSNYFLFLPKFLYHKVRVLAPFKRMTEFKIKIKKEIVLSLSRGWIKTIGENPH